MTQPYATTINRSMIKNTRPTSQLIFATSRAILIPLSLNAFASGPVYRSSPGLQD